MDRRHIHTHLFEHELSIDQIESSVGLRSHRHRTVFKRCVGTTMHTYLVDLRLKAAAELILDPRLDLAAIAHEVGYADVRSFRRAFKRRFGVAPSRFRRQGGESDG